MSELKIGMIGLDTSHVVAFTRILNDSNNEHFSYGWKSSDRISGWIIGYGAQLHPYRRIYKGTA